MERRQFGLRAKGCCCSLLTRANRPQAVKLGLDNKYRISHAPYVMLDDARCASAGSWCSQVGFRPDRSLAAPDRLPSTLVSRNMVGAPHQHSFAAPHGLCPSTAAIPQVTRTACSRPDTTMLPRLLMLAWASRAVSLREASPGDFVPSFARVEMNALRLRLRRALAQFTPGFAGWLLGKARALSCFRQE